MRLARVLDVKVVDLDANKEAKGQTHDISADGIGFITDMSLDRDTNLELWLYIPDNAEPLYTKGKVVWAKMVDSNAYRVGVRLNKVDFAGISRILRTIA
ncbi:MAG: PilZ domain-containing protein [Candidatus Omnitrophica bacterium]|nr:PilZ domain-containing protein [Candidatus Omnitrophota bacterium]